MLIFHDLIIQTEQQSAGIYNLIYYIKHNYDFFHASFSSSREHKKRTLHNYNQFLTCIVESRSGLGGFMFIRSSCAQPRMKFPAQSRRTCKIVPHNSCSKIYVKAS